MLSCSYHISRPANLFHFVNNLSQWHFSCRRHYNDFWLRETGPLTGAESEALQTAAAALPRLEAQAAHLDAVMQSEGVARAFALVEPYLASPIPPLQIDLLISRGRGSCGGGANEADHISLEALETEDMGRAPRG